MDVLFDYNVFLRAPHSGASRYFCEIAKRFGNYDVNANIAYLLHNNFHLEEIFGSPRGMQFPLSSTIYHAVNETYFNYSLVTRKPDVVHETHYSGRSYRPDGPKIVYTIHDMTPELFPKYFKNYRPVIELRNIALSSHHYFITISDNTKNDLMRLFNVDERRISVIHHGIPNWTADPAVERVPNRILFVGGRSGYKNFKNLALAMPSVTKQLGPVDLVIIGGGPLMVQEREWLGQSPLLSYKQYSCSDEELKLEYQRAGLFVYPSLYEGFGLPLLEAMSVGCLVACSDASCFPEIAADAAAFFDPNSIASISSCIVSLLGDETGHSLLRARGAARCKAFDWARSAEMHARFYNSICEEAR